MHTSNGIVESLLGKVASLVGSVQDLVVENREIQGKTQTNRVGRRKLALSNISSSLIGLEGFVGRVLALVASGELSEVAVVVALPVLGNYVSTIGRDKW